MDAESMLARMELERFDGVILDLDSEGLPQDPLTLCEELTGRWPEIPVTVVSSHDSFEVALRSIRVGAYDYIRRPVSLRLATQALERLSRHRALHRQLAELETDADLGGSVGPMVGNSPAIRSVFSLMRRAARSDVTVMITGESGTGKELVARGIHALSARRAQPFVAVNCGALTASLLETELFGHLRGAYTDAHKDRDGLFVRANGGTVLLDEIGDMPMDLQAKLLRVLQEKTVRPVGGEHETAVDVRVISSTNHDLEQRVRDDLFRDDLYFRLNVVGIKTPPLRQRGNDVILLAEDLLSRAASRCGKKVTRFSSAALRALLAYQWPGNVRELENAIERAITLCQGEEIGIDDLPAAVRQTPQGRNAQETERLEALPTLDEVELSHIQSILDSVDGNKTRASEILGIDRRTIYRRLRGAGLA